MAWARLDDGWHDHEKVAAAGLEAAGLWVMCLTWAHRARKTSKTPGVIPESVLTRFAGAKAKKLAAHLHAVGMFDAKTEVGWPIHDFSEYLPKYDTEQAKAAGSAGGKARAAKQTAKRTASKPLSEPGSESQANQVAKPSTRASARRNPVPVPSEELRSSGADERRDDDSDTEDVNSQHLIRGWIESLGDIRPDSRTKGHVAAEVKRLLSEGVPADAIAAGLTLWQSKGLSPAVLASVVHGVRVNGPTGQAPRQLQAVGALAVDPARAEDMRRNPHKYR